MEIIGTIIASTLTYDKLCIQLNERASFNAKKSTYAPCDGRSVTGSYYSEVTDKTKTLDLRGMFLRGLNMFYEDEQAGPLDQSKADPDSRSIGDYQEDDFKKHNHGGGNHSHNILGESGAAGGNQSFITGDRRSSTQWSGNNNSMVYNSGEIIDTEGGEETRPKNIAVYYYMRINYR